MQRNMDVVPMRLVCTAGFDCIRGGIAAAMAKNSRRFTASILKLLFLVRRIYRTSKLPAKSSEEISHERSECKPDRAQPSRHERSECKPDAERTRDSAQPQERAQPSRHERSECKPDAERKRDSAQPQERAQPSSNETYYLGSSNRADVYFCRRAAPIRSGVADSAERAGTGLRGCAGAIFSSRGHTIERRCCGRCIRFERPSVRSDAGQSVSIRVRQ